MTRRDLFRRFFAAPVTAILAAKTTQPPVRGSIAGVVVFEPALTRDQVFAMCAVGHPAIKTLTTNEPVHVTITDGEAWSKYARRNLHQWSRENPF